MRLGDAQVDELSLNAIDKKSSEIFFEVPELCSANGAGDADGLRVITQQLAGVRHGMRPNADAMSGISLRAR